MRSSSWHGVVGQATAVRLLSGALASGRLSHAYLFHGPEGTGKATVAGLLAQSLTCLAPVGTQPCGNCRSCRKVAAGYHPDILWLTTDGKTIKVEPTERLRVEMYAQPNEGRRKVAVIEEADRLHPAAANRLLKTLEEPPAYAVFILTTANPANVLPTILSRCQPVTFTPIARPEVERFLTEQCGVAAAAARVAAALSGGSLGRAMVLATAPEQAAWREEARQLLAQTRNADDARLLGLAEELDRRRQEDLDDVLQAAALWLRDAVVWREAGTEALVVGVDQLGFLNEFARRHPTPVLQGMFAAVDEARRQLGRNANARLVLDVLLLKLASLST